MKHFRKILFPFALLYGFAVFLRNKLFDLGVFSSKSYTFPVVCVGNLNVGGTGKSPMVELLIKLLKDRKKMAVLSRGYKRETNGFFLLTGKETAAQVGDEPLQFKTKFPEIAVAVDENRQRGIEKLRQLQTPPEVVLLDDAFQHRKVRAGLNILLTAYGDLYCDDFLLPAGNLREQRSGAARADIVVVTKCPEKLTLENQKQIEKKLGLKQNQQLFFSAIAYSTSVSNGKISKNLEDLGFFTLVTGIANPKPLSDFLHSMNLDFNHLEFSDHHRFKDSELENLRKKKRIVTTEKDFMRLKNELSKEQLFFLPIKTEISDHVKFEEMVKVFAGN